MDLYFILFSIIIVYFLVEIVLDLAIESLCKLAPYLFSRFYNFFLALYVLTPKMFRAFLKLIFIAFFPVTV